MRMSQSFINCIKLSEKIDMGKSVGSGHDVSRKKDKKKIDVIFRDHLENPRENVGSAGFIIVICKPVTVFHPLDSH